LIIVSYDWFYTLSYSDNAKNQNYADGEDGRLLAESLEMTFREYRKHIEIAEFSLTIG